MEIEFAVNNEVKQEYLDSMPTATANSESYVLRSVDEFEKQINKQVFNMTHSELHEMLAWKFKNSSEKSILKNVSIIKRYINYCIEAKLVNHMENRLEVFTIEDAREFVHKQAFINRYPSKEQIKKYQDLLVNEQDRLLLELPFIGVRGRTVEGGTLEEIINLELPELEDQQKGFITLTQNNGKHRRLKVSSSTMNLIIDAYNQEFYLENNGETPSNVRLSAARRYRINKVERFVFRVPGKNKFQKFTPELFNARIRKIQKYIDNPYITYTSIYMAGMLDKANDIYKENGFVSTEEYIDICAQFNYGFEDPTKYWHVLKTTFEQYVKINS